MKSPNKKLEIKLTHIQLDSLEYCTRYVISSYSGDDWISPTRKKELKRIETLNRRIAGVLEKVRFNLNIK